MGHVKRDKRAMREAKELADRIMELYEILKKSEEVRLLMG